MDIVKVCPEIQIAMDIDSGLIAEMRKDILVVDLHPVEDEINKLAHVITSYSIHYTKLYE